MTTPSPGIREGSASKRDAIVTAARELFLADGFERTSVDTVAARASVSKRTVYDYYGDKRRLLLAVVELTIDALASRIEHALDENLREVSDLEASLVGLAESITTSALGSSEYAALRRLISTESANLPELRQHRWASQEPEEGLAERFAELGEQGLLHVPHPRVAADHFVALTLTPSAASLSTSLAPEDADTHRLIVEGVRAFLRAYAPQS